MKKTNLFQLLVIMLSFGFLTACSKEKITVPEATTQMQSFRNNSLDLKDGSLTGNVIPGSIKAYVTLHFGSTELGPYYLNPSGQFKIGNLAPGVYKLVLHWWQPDNSTTNSESQMLTRSFEIKIYAGEVTILDPIYL